MEVSGRVAVVTGAASGMGRSMADTFAGAGMKVVLADIEQAALDLADEGLQTGHTLNTTNGRGRSVQVRGRFSSPGPEGPGRAVVQVWTRQALGGSRAKENTVRPFRAEGGVVLPRGGRCAA